MSSFPPFSPERETFEPLPLSIQIHSVRLRCLFSPRCLYLRPKIYIYYFMLYLAESLTGRSYTEGKLLRYFPLWREGKGRKLCLLSANSYGIWEGVKQNVFFLQSVRMQKLINESMRNVFLSGERGGPSKMVESRFLFVGIRESKRMLHMAFL